CRVRQDHIDLEVYEIGCKSRQGFVFAFREAPFDEQVLAFDVAQLAHSLQECAVIACAFLSRLHAEVTDAPDFSLALSIREGLPCKSGDTKQDELTPLHWIASSLR